eukprot:1946503-Pleurochrysis_carterae.AAC.1
MTRFAVKTNFFNAQGFDRLRWILRCVGSKPGSRVDCESLCCDGGSRRGNNTEATARLLML